MIKKISLFVCFYVLIHASDYYPLAVGNYWVYEHNTVVSDSITVSTYDSSVIISETSFQDMQLFTGKSFTGISLENLTDSVQFFIASKDNRIYRILDTTFFDSVRYESKHSYTDGEQWNTGAGELVVEFLDGPVTVNAGTFDACFHVFYEFCLAETYFERKYAPDVGMIYAKRNWGDYTITLLRYNVSSTSISETFSLLKHSGKPSLYPLTFNSHIIFSVPSKYRLTSMKIFDFDGRRINSFSGITDNRACWNIKSVPSGTYIVQASGSGAIINQMITVRK